MTEFWAELLETAVNIGLAALVARFLVRRLTVLPANPVAFALAIGVLLGRQQAVAGSDLAQAGAGTGGLIILGLLWFFWFKRAPSEAEHG